LTKFIFFASRSKKNDIAGKQKKLNLEEKSGSSNQICYRKIFKANTKTNSQKYSFLIKSKTKDG